MLTSYNKLHLIWNEGIGGKERGGIRRDILDRRDLKRRDKVQFYYIQISPSGKIPWKMTFL